MREAAHPIVVAHVHKVGVEGEPVASLDEVLTQILAVGLLVGAPPLRMYHWREVTISSWLVALRRNRHTVGGLGITNHLAGRLQCLNPVPWCAEKVRALPAISFVHGAASLGGDPIRGCRG